MHAKNVFPNVLQPLLFGSDQDVDIHGSLERTDLEINLLLLPKGNDRGMERE